MDINQRQEQYSRAYVQAIASVAGFATYVPAVDEDSIDLGLAARGGGGTIKSPRLEIQLKSCRRSDVLTESELRYPLKIKNYNDLRVEDVLVPRILVVVLVPGDPEPWLNHSEDLLALKRCGYWVSLKGRPEVANEDSVTIHIPRVNQFTVDQITSLMARVGRGEFI